MKSDDVICLILIGFFGLPMFVYAMRQALSGRDPDA